MSLLTRWPLRHKAVTAALSVVAMAGIGLGVADAANAPVSNGTQVGRGINQFGMTSTFFNGKVETFRYTHGFFCDTSVSSQASSGCEAGANFKTPPAKSFDPLYITVPLGFTETMGMDCPDKLVCVDHPGTIDLSRLEPALKPLYPQYTDAQLSAALENYATPEHQHFITDDNGNAPEWWDVKVIGVTDRKTYDAITAHKSYAYIQQLQKAKNKYVTATIPTNLFLFFASK